MSYWPTFWLLENASTFFSMRDIWVGGVPSTFFCMRDRWVGGLLSTFFCMRDSRLVGYLELSPRRGMDGLLAFLALSSRWGIDGLVGYLTLYSGWGIYGTFFWMMDWWDLPRTFFSTLRESCPRSASSSRNAMNRCIAARASRGSRVSDCENIIWGMAAMYISAPAWWR